MPVESGITALAQRVGLEIKTLKAASIVADVVACYDNTSTGHTGSETDIAHYTKSNLTDKDVILVLKDEQHDDQKAYYRYNKSSKSLVFEIAEDKIDHPIATTTTFGAVKPDGTTITIADGVISYTLPTATATRLGGVKIATDGGLQITTAGELSVKASALPIATNTVLGAVKIATDGGLNITSDGVLSVQTSNLPIATKTQLGVVKVDGTTITAAADGTLTAVGGAVDASSLPIASNSSLGAVMIGEQMSIDSAGYINPNIPYASNNTRGIVMIDTTSGLAINTNGVLSLNLSTVDASDLPIASEDHVGVVKPDGSTLRMDADGTMYVDLAPASKTSTGVVQVGDGLTVTSSGLIAINAKSPLTIVDNTLQIADYTEEVWELTMEDGSTVKRTFLSKVTS